MLGLDRNQREFAQAFRIVGRACLPALGFHLTQVDVSGTGAPDKTGKGNEGEDRKERGELQRVSCERVLRLSFAPLPGDSAILRDECHRAGPTAAREPSPSRTRTLAVLSPCRPAASSSL